MKRTGHILRNQRTPSVTGTSNPRLEMSVAAVIALVCLAVVALPAPVEMRVLATVGLLSVPAWALSRLLLGTAEGIDARCDGLDESVRVLLPALFTVLLLLGSALALGPVGLRLTTTNLSLALFALSTIMLSLEAFRTCRSPSTPRGAVADKAWREIGGRVVVSLALTTLCVGAVAGALALQTEPSERYVNTILTGPDSVIAGQLSVSTGSPVEIEWTSYSYGFILPTQPPTITTTIGGISPADLRLVTSPPSAPFDTDTDARSAQVGTVSFSAPAAPGRYRVGIDITTASAPDNTGVGPTSLVLYLSVASP